MPTPTLQGLEGRFVHKISTKNQIPDAGIGAADNAVWLQIEPGGVQRTSSITLPQLIFEGVSSDQMEWDPTAIVAASTVPGGWISLVNIHPFWGPLTTVHNLIRQINQRQGYGPVDGDHVVVKASLLDQLGATIWDYFPGSSPVASQANFPLFFDDDGDGRIEPRAVRLTLTTTHTPLVGVDAGRVVLRLNNIGLDESPAW
jgi:hypothetical protein